MTTVWCEERYCIHCVIGKCDASDVSFKIGHDGIAHCHTYEYEDAERIREGVDYDDPSWCHGDR